MRAFLMSLAPIILAMGSVQVAAQDETAEETPQETPQETQEQPSDEWGKKLSDLFKTADGEEFSFLKMLEEMRAENGQPQGFDPSKPVVGFAFGVNEDGKMFLNQVLARSAAEGAGLEKDMVILRINGITMKGFELAEIRKILGAIDGEIIFDIEGRGRYSLIKAPIPDASE